MEELFRVAAACLAAGLFGQLLKKETPVFSLLLSLAAGALLLFAILDKLTRLEETAALLREMLPGQSPQILLNVLGIALVTQFLVDFCRECGMQSAAAAADLLGKLMALLHAAPLYTELLRCFARWLS